MLTNYITFLEEYSLGEFTFGFEFEGFTTPDILSYVGFKDYIKLMFGTDDFSLKDDPSIIPISNWQHDDGYPDEDDELEGRTFELASPVMKVTPENIQKVILFFRKLNHTETIDRYTKAHIETNESCGFHIHLGIPNFDSGSKNTLFENFWIICNIATNDDFFDIIKEMKTSLFRVDFSDDQYASIQFLSRLREQLFHMARSDDKEQQQKYIRELQEKYYSDEKFRAFRLHPQGTLEWRGPRNFLDYGTQYIKPFLYKIFLPFVKHCATALKNTTISIDGYTITKEFLYKNLANKNFLNNKKTNHGFATHKFDPALIQEFYAQNPGLHFSKDKASDVVLQYSKKNPDKIVIGGGDFKNAEFNNLTFEAWREYAFSDDHTTYFDNCTINSCDIYSAYFTGGGNNIISKSSIENSYIVRNTDIYHSKITKTKIRLDAEMILDNIVCNDCTFEITFNSLTQGGSMKMINVNAENCTLMLSTGGHRLLHLLNSFNINDNNKITLVNNSSGAWKKIKNVSMKDLYKIAEFFNESEFKNNGLKNLTFESPQEFFDFANKESGI